MNKIADVLLANWFGTMVVGISLNDISAIISIIFLFISCISAILSLIVRIRDMLKDKVIDEEEQKEIIDSVDNIKDQIDDIKDAIDDYKESKK